MVSPTYPARKTRMKYSPARRARAATTIQRAYRARKSRVSRTRQIGSSIWTGNCKSQVTANQDMILRTDNTLWVNDITDLPQGNEMDQRERGIINCRGFKINCLFYNILASTAVFVNFAVIAPKKLSTDTPAQGENFFRANGSNRSTDFAGVGETPFERHIRSINPDDYTILWHKRFMLAPSQAAAGGANMGSLRSIRHIAKYIRLNRAITYERQESIKATDGQVAIAYWFGRAGATDGSTQANTVSVHERVVMYFKEPKQ